MEIMSVSLKFAFVFLLWAYVIEADSPRWDLMHQEGYVIDVHHVDVPWYNESYGKVEKFEMVKFNRTFRRVLNASMHLFKELSKDLRTDIQLYKLTKSNVYKFFPFTATFQICEEYAKNTFGSKDMVAKFTNCNPCPQKPGPLYVKHLYADHSRFPPLIPTGDYRVDAKLYHKGEGVMLNRVFLTIIPKARVPYEN